MNSDERTCATCGETKPQSEFSRKWDRWPSRHCKPCRALRERAARKARLERALQTPAPPPERWQWRPAWRALGLMEPR